MTDPVRLAKRVAELARCSRADAEQYVEGGWVRVDGDVVEEPQFMVSTQVVEVDPDARLQATEPATLLLHKPVDIAFAQTPTLVSPDTHARVDDSGVRMHDRDFVHLAPLMPLDADASGLVVLSQDPRVKRRLSDDATRIEQEFIVEIEGPTAPYTLSRLARGLSYQGRPLPACKVSWQNEVRLRFAIKDVRPGQLRHMCREVGLDVVTMKRIRLGRISLGKMPAGHWRYLPVTDRF